MKPQYSHKRNYSVKGAFSKMNGQFTCSHSSSMTNLRGKDTKTKSTKCNLNISKKSVQQRSYSKSKFELQKSKCSSTESSSGSITRKEKKTNENCFFSKNGSVPFLNEVGGNKGVLLKLNKMSTCMINSPIGSPSFIDSIKISIADSNKILQGIKFIDNKNPNIRTKNKDKIIYAILDNKKEIDRNELITKVARRVKEIKYIKNIKEIHKPYNMHKVYSEKLPIANEIYNYERKENIRDKNVINSEIKQDENDDMNFQKKTKDFISMLASSIKKGTNEILLSKICLKVLF